jgi:hypothetical protein
MFSEKLDFKLSQYNRLSENSNEWQEEILKLVHEKVPQRTGLKVKVVFQEVDEEKGYAVGSAALQEPRSGKQVNIPLVIKAFHIAPLDIMIKDDKAFPFTAESLKEAIFDPDVFSGTVPGGRKPDDVFYDDSLYSQTFPPIYGKYTYSAPFRVLNAISGTLGAEDIASFRELFDEDPALMRRFVKVGAAELVNGVSQESAAKEKELQKATKTILTIKKQSPNAYLFYGNSDRVFDPALLSIDRLTLSRFLHHVTGQSDQVMDILNDVDKSGERTTRIPLGDKPLARPAGEGVPSKLGDAKKTPFLFNPLADQGVVQSITEHGLYGVKDKAGVMARGIVIPNVIDFNGKKTGLKIFVSKGISSVQQRFAGVALKDTQDQPEGSARYPMSDPEPGKQGIFLFESKGGPIATVPFTVRGLSEYKGTIGIKGIDYTGEPVNFILARGLQAIGKAQHSELLGPLASRSEPNYYIPDQFRFVELGNLRHLAESPEEFRKQAAAELLDRKPLRIIPLQGDRFVFRGPIEKYASPLFDFDNLAGHEAAFLLASWGCEPAAASRFLKEAHIVPKAEVHGLSWPTLPDTTKTAAAEETGEIISALKERGAALTKLAAGVKDAETVDKVLALNFVNPMNVQRFVGAIPQYKEVVSSLAKLILAARLGMEDIPEEAAVSAMMEMQEVLRGLERLRVLGQTQQQAV